MTPAASEGAGISVGLTAQKFSTFFYQFVQVAKNPKNHLTKLK